MTVMTTTENRENAAAGYGQQKVNGAAVDLKNKTGTELNATANAAAAQTKIQAAMLMAMNRPRDEQRVKDKLVAACGDEDFAEEALYSFPRGGSQVEGLSVNVAREMARLWGNLHYGVDVIGEDETTRQIRGWAWDLETGAQATLDDAFAKMVYRRKTGWEKADERELRELNNRRGAILERNCILKLIPPGLKKSAERAIRETLKRAAQKAPEAAIQKTAAAFAELNIPATEIEKYLGHPLKATTPEEIVKLRGVYRSIVDGNSRWDEYVAVSATGQAAATSTGVIDIEAIKAGAEPNRGHGEEGLETLAGTPDSGRQSENEPEAEPTPAPDAYEAPAKPKQALADFATEQNGGDKAKAKAAIAQAAMDFFNKAIKTVNDLTSEEAEKIYRSARTGKYQL